MASSAAMKAVVRAMRGLDLDALKKRSAPEPEKPETKAEPSAKADLKARELEELKEHYARLLARKTAADKPGKQEDARA